MSTYFPFHALGLQCNPFRALTDEEWGRLALLPRELGALDPTAHVQILGERGRGKTSVLMGLAAQGRQTGQKTAYEYLAVGQDRFKTPLAGLEVFLLDEAQRLNQRERGRLVATLSARARPPRLFLSSHEDLAPLFARHRLNLVSLQLPSASLEQLRAVVERRLAYFALPGGPGLTLASEVWPYLHERCGGNLRTAEHLLYEACQELATPGEITVELLAALTLPPADAPPRAAPR